MHLDEAGPEESIAPTFMAVALIVFEIFHFLTFFRASSNEALFEIVKIIFHYYYYSPFFFLPELQVVVLKL